MPLTQPNVIGSAKNIMLLFLLILLALQPSVAQAQTEVHPLDHAIGGNGYHGGSATIALTIQSQGVTFTLSYTVSGGDAYDVAGSILTGRYDIILHKYIAFGSGKNYRTKSWSSHLNFESYSVGLISISLTDPYIDKSTCNTLHYAHTYTRGHALFKVVHSTWWGASKEVKYDYIPLSNSAYVACTTLA